MPPGRKQRLSWTFLLSSKKRGARNSADPSQPWRRAGCSCSRSSEQLQRELRQIPAWNREWQLDPQLPARSIQHWGHKKEHREHPTGNYLINHDFQVWQNFRELLFLSGAPLLLQTFLYSAWLEWRDPTFLHNSLTGVSSTGDTKKNTESIPQGMGWSNHDFQVWQNFHELLFLSGDPWLLQTSLYSAWLGWRCEKQVSLS